ncbi:hypothetical protein [Kistimonas asteriae]|uniref:hypothetical protein n=1 Tax=Kistimonas asteriae TaxID=517724 RepID=UPI001BAB53C8|nr:hypothetical protein [Kistimonas asteriae]
MMIDAEQLERLSSLRSNLARMAASMAELENRMALVNHQCRQIADEMRTLRTQIKTPPDKDKQH